MTEAADLTAVSRPAQQMNQRKRDRMETAKRSALIQAAVQVVANCGFHGASVSLIANHAGVASGTVYVHFESKNPYRPPAGNGLATSEQSRQA